MEMMFRRAINSGEFQGGFEDWKKLNEQFVDVGLCEVNEGLSYDQAVKKVFGETEGQNILNKENEIEEKVTIADVYAEAKIAGISPAEYAEKINEGIDKQNEEILERSENEKALILKEAQNAGMNTTDPDVRKKILENFERQKNESGIEPTKKEKLFEKVLKIRKDEGDGIDYLVGEKIAASGYKK